MVQLFPEINSILSAGITLLLALEVIEQFGKANCFHSSLIIWGTQDEVELKINSEGMKELSLFRVS